MNFNLTTKDGQPIELGSPENQVWIRFGLVLTAGVFCLFGCLTMISKVLSQQKTISAGNKAVQQLNTDLSSASVLSSQYLTLFENNNPTNFLGGKNDSSAQATPPDVDNARLALDALPTTYDYPALLASVTKIMTNNSISSPNITGTDQTGAVNSTPLANPQPAAIKLTVTGTGSYAAVASMLKDLERSIRPFDVTDLQLSGSGSSLTFSASLTTYFQPAKTLSQGSTP